MCRVANDWWLERELDRLDATEVERSTAGLLFRQPNGRARAKKYIREIERQRQPGKGQLNLFKNQERAA